MSHKNRDKAHLLDELGDVGFELFSDQTLTAQIIDEILYAQRIPAHEGRRPSYGAMVVSKKSDRILASEAKQLFHLDSVELGRELADGEFSFLVRDGGKTSLLMLSRSFGDEYGAYYVRDSFLHPFASSEPPPIEIGLVQRTSNGTIRVLGPKNIAIRMHDSWKTKEYKYSYVEGIHLSTDLGGEELLTIREAAALCVHGLSGRGIGATLVVKRTPGNFAYVSPAPETEWVEGAVVDDPAWHYALMAVLSKKDGATLVRHSGEVEAIAVTLTPDEGRKVSPSRAGTGTRHRSAKIYSANNPDCIVIVVSQDGPVTVFIAGAPVPPCDPMKRADPIYSTRCTACELDLRSEQRTDDGSNSCPSCGADLNQEAAKYLLRPYVALTTVASPAGERLFSNCGGRG